MRRWWTNPLHVFCDQTPGQGGGGTGARAGTAAPPAATPPAATQAAPAGLTQEQFNQLTQSLGQTVQQHVATATQSVQQQVQQLNTRLDQLSQPQRNASQLFGGGAPAVQSGERALTSRGYQYWRAMGVRQGFLPAEQAKIEMELHARLYQMYVQQGGMVLSSGQSILIPLGSQQLMYDAEQPGSPITPAIAGEVRQMLAAGVLDFDPDRARWLRQSMGRAIFHPSHQQALSINDDTGMGVFLGPTQHHGELIELIRAREVMARVGASELSLPPNGRLQFNKQTGATTAYWVGEVPSNKSTPTITSSEPTTGLMTLMAKKLAVLTKLPNELLRFAGPETEAFLRRDMATVAALESSRAMLDGVANGLRVKGLITYAGIQTHIASTVGADGNTFEPEDVALMVSLLEEADYAVEDGNFAWVMRPKMFTNLRNRRTAAHTAGTYDGPWLFPLNRDDMAKGNLATLDGYPVVKSSQVSNSRAKGSATNLSYILGGMWRHWLIGRVGVAEFATTTQGDTPFQTDQTWVRFIQHLDAGPRYENAFVLCDTLDMDLP
jgi:HK97 family phage major capsid protein